MTEHPPVVVLNVSECWGLLRQAVVGRLAVMLDDQPDIFPVNYLADRGSIVFRTAAGTKLANSVGRQVAFEVDGYDPTSGEAWSVVVKGKAWEVKQLHDVLDALDLPLFSWHAAPKRHIIRIEPESVTGRRFHVLDAPSRHMPTRARRAAAE
jgi:uncharacterized protein